MDWSKIRSRPGDRVSRKWSDLIDKADSSRVVAGKFTRMRSLPGGGVLVSGMDPMIRLKHPWKMSGLDEENSVRVSLGMVAGQHPWVSEEFRLGDKDENEEFVRVPLFPKDEGSSFLAIGVNINNSESKQAEIDPGGKDTWEQLRITQIEELPRGFGTGGVLEDSDGWAWYPLVKIMWEEERVASQFQIVMHNLSHFVTKGKNNEARHFFPPL